MKLLKAKKIFIDKSILENRCILINRGIIEDIIQEEEIKWFENYTEIIDLSDSIVIPGFIDTHTHMVGFGLNYKTSIERFESFAETVDHIRDYIINNDQEIYIFTDFDESRWSESKRPRREELDKITDKPIFLRRICGHIGVGNTSFINLLSKKIDISKTSWDEDSGTFWEEVPLKIHSIFPPTPELLEKSVLEAQGIFLKNGFTMIHEIGSHRSLRLYQKLKRENKLKIRIRFYTTDTSPETFEKTGIESGLGDELLKFQGLKYFADGSVGGESAYFGFNYGSKKSQGLWLLEDGIENEFKKAIELNLQIAIHAIGNLAIKKVLDIIEKIDSPELFRIEHFEFPEMEDVERAKKLNIKLSIQPNFIYNWGQKGGMYEQKLGDFYINNNPLKTYVEQGLIFAFGTDAMPPDPLHALKGAQSHPNPEQSLTQIESIIYFTSTGPILTNEEGKFGKIEPGYVADFTVLDDKLENVKATIIGGELAYHG